MDREKTKEKRMLGLWVFVIIIWVCIWIMGTFELAVLFLLSFILSAIMAIELKVEELIEVLNEIKNK